MKILFLEPFFGGSHKSVALGFEKFSSHDVTLLTMPARFWKWRMRGSALHFLSQIPDITAYDLVIATDMMDLTDFIALAGKKMPPVWFYFHENQLSYPLAPGKKRDSHLGFTNIMSAFAADRVVFNSYFHLNDFFIHAERLIKQMPDFRPDHILEEIKEKSIVIYPGCWFDPGEIALKEKDNESPLIIWNHRWEHDKNPEPFFNALSFLKKADISFSLALLGEQYKLYPSVFDHAREEFKDELVVFGYAESREDYVKWLEKGSVVVSTANQENFGISIIEAVRYGCIPLLPDRLSYPELMPEDLHPLVIYQDGLDLCEKLKHLLTIETNNSSLRERLSTEAAKYSWKNIIKQFDRFM